MIVRVISTERPISQAVTEDLLNELTSCVGFEKCVKVNVREIYFGLLQSGLMHA